MSTPQPPYPLHESVASLLDPQYVEFYNKYIINAQQVQYQPVEASRTSGTLIPGASEPLTVAETKDYHIERQETKGDGPVAVRVFTPTGEAPEGGWPAFLYMHGGGWVLGNINTENVHCTHWAQLGKCVVVSVDYRLAPESPFPAAVDDTWEAYLWLAQNKAGLNINTDRLAAGGSSAGGNLTAVLAHMLIERNNSSTTKLPGLKFQLLIVPVCDNNATKETYDTWKKYEFTAALPADKMMWYRYKYLPNKEDWTNPRASPINYPDASFKQLPPAHIAVAGLDILSGEGEAYRQKLEKNGVKVTFKSYPGVPHPVMAMNGVLDKGKQLVHECSQAIHNALYNN
jgi:acetyl esterase/lipase